MAAKLDAWAMAISPSARRRLDALDAQTRSPRPFGRATGASAGAQQQQQQSQLLAGVGKADITNPNVLVPGVDVSLVQDAATAAPIDNPMYAKALLVRGPSSSTVGAPLTTVGFVTLDLVSFGEIGHITNEFLPRMRARLQRELGLDPSGIVFNVNHGHGIPCDDVEQRTFEAIAAAAGSMVPVALGSGRGHEDRITENRRMFLRDGSEADARGAYALPPDAEVESIGPIDPSIGVLRLDRLSDGATLAVVYNFACHPIMGTPTGSNGADLTGFASRLVEDALSPGVTMALFLQGCSGDVNPVRAVRAVQHTRSAATDTRVVQQRAQDCIAFLSFFFRVPLLTRLATAARLCRLATRTSIDRKTPCHWVRCSGTRC